LRATARREPPHLRLYSANVQENPESLNDGRQQRQQLRLEVGVFHNHHPKKVADPAGRYHKESPSTPRAPHSPTTTGCGQVVMVAKQCRAVSECEGRHGPGQAPLA
jgi:hypothetical protein